MYNLRNIISSLQLYEEFNEPHYATWFVKRFEMRYWGGLWLPSILLTDSITSIRSILCDHVIFRFAKGLYCKSCLRPLEIPETTATYLRECQQCLQSETRKKFSCILVGAGLPYGAPCSCDFTAVLPCDDVSHCMNYCATNYVLYIGVIGEFIKVGITRADLTENPPHYMYRLVSQSLDYAFVLEHHPPLNLAQAQRLEAQISHDFGITDAISFQTKVNTLFNEQTAVLEAKSLTEDILDSYQNFELIKEVNVAEESICSPVVSSRADLVHYINSHEIEHVSIDSILMGRIVVTKGSLALIEYENRVFLVNLAELEGHGIITAEEGWF